MFVASYALDGTPLAARRFGASGTDAVQAIATDAGGAVYLSGTYSTSIDFGDGPHDNTTSGSGSVEAGYLVKMRP